MPDDQIWILSKITLGIKYRIDLEMNWKIKIPVIRELNSAFISYLYWIPICVIALSVQMRDSTL